MTAPRSVVVIAASSGGLKPLRSIVAGLPSDFPATVLVVNHTAPTRTSLLPVILSSDGPLPAMHPSDRQRLEAGRILVAPAGRHLRLARGPSVRVTDQPADTPTRPSADVLFESAARIFGRNALGVVLSGMGSDGTRGLVAIRAAGGLTIVQDPSDAQFDAMPRNALSAVVPDACVPGDEIALLLDRLVRTRLTEPSAPAPRRRRKALRSARSLHGLRVLVVEDRYLLRAAMVRMLRDLGCSAVGPAPDMASGVRLLDSVGADVDCALLDVDLGGERVFPLASMLRDRGIAIVFATGHGAATLPEEWLAYARIEKPFDTKTLGAALRRTRRGARKVARRPPRQSLSERAVEELKNFRNLLMISRAVKSSVTDAQGDTVLYDANASVRACRRAIETSRAKLHETAKAITTSRNRKR
jgi:DNA-binding response OmpR family regulator